MALNFAIRTIFEIAGILLLLYGFIHEDKLIVFEDKIKSKIKEKRERSGRI